MNNDDDFVVVVVVELSVAFDNYSSQLGPFRFFSRVKLTKQYHTVQYVHCILTRI